MYKKLKPEEIKMGMKVKYHPIVGEDWNVEPSHTVRSEAYHSESDYWVVFLERKSGYVLLESLEKEGE